MAPNRQFIVSPILTAIAVGYRNPAFTLIADRVLPRLAVMQEVFKWTAFPLAEAFTLPETEVGRRGRPAQMEFTGTEETSATSDYGLDSDIPYTDIDAAEAARNAGLGNVDPEKLAATQLSNLVELAREVRAAAVVQNAANYDAARKVTLAGTDQFSAFATSDPYAVIDQAMNGTLVYRPNTISMGRVVWNIIKRHPKLIKAVKNDTGEGAISRRQFAELFEIDEDRLLIGEGWLNTAKKGQAANLQQVWGKSIQCTFIDPSKGSAEDPTITWGFTAQLGSKIAGGGEDPHIGIKGGKFVRVGEQVKELVAAKDTGYQISGAVA